MYNNKLCTCNIFTLYNKATTLHFAHNKNIRFSDKLYESNNEKS